MGGRVEGMAVSVDGWVGVMVDGWTGDKVDERMGLK